MNKRVYPLTFQIIMLIILNVMAQLNYLTFSEVMLSITCVTLFAFWMLEKIYSHEIKKLLNDAIAFLEKIRNATKD